jgi:uncharacterized protein
MKLAGSYTLGGTPEQVWAVITDPQRLARALPGCERLDPDGADRYKAVIGFALAAISGKYSGSLEFADKKQPHSLRLKLEGRGTPGFLKGEGQVQLQARGKQTELRYAGEAQVGGMIAGVGQRMIEVAARRLVAQFFDKLAQEFPDAAARDA